jgi:hypothetical protein
VTTDPNNGIALALHCALMRNLGVAPVNPLVIK